MNLTFKFAKTAHLKRTVYSDFRDLGLDLRIRKIPELKWKVKKEGEPFANIYSRYTIDEMKEMAKKLFREKVKQTHPDVGGDSQEFINVCIAYKHMLKVFQFKSTIGDL